MDNDIRCNEKQCNGNCWLNVAGDFNVWEIVSCYCDGSKEEQQLIGDIFNGFKSKEEILNKYDFNEEEKEIVKGDW